MGIKRTTEHCSLRQKKKIGSYGTSIRFYGRKRQNKFFYKKSGLKSGAGTALKSATNPYFFVENFFSDRSKKFSTHPTTMPWVSKEPPSLVLYARKRLGSCDKPVEKYRRKTGKNPHFQRLPFEQL